MPGKKLIGRETLTILSGNEVLQTTDRRQTNNGVYRAARSQLKIVDYKERRNNSLRNLLSAHRILVAQPFKWQ